MDSKQINKHRPKVNCNYSALLTITGIPGCRLTLDFQVLGGCPAYRACRIPHQPRIQTMRMEAMFTDRKHPALLPGLEALQTNSAFNGVFITGLKFIAWY